MRFFLGAMAICLTTTFASNAQDRQTSAPSTMRFEVASVRPDDGPFKPPSFALSADNSFRDPQGRFHADFSPEVYIQFAYKLWLTDEERKDMLANVPEWVAHQRFDIEATAPATATKDDYRAMMKTLLAERFGLKLHFEDKDKPVLAMVLVKDGTPGPKLIPHEKGQPCNEKPLPGSFDCYVYGAHPDKDGMWMAGSRATTMDLIANFVGSVAGNYGEISRRVVDRTGLTGLWDFTVVAPPPARGPDAPVPAFTALEAIRDQLGIRLKSTRAMVSLPMIDHITKPEEN